MATDSGDVRVQARAQVEQTAQTVRTQASDQLHQQVGTRSAKLGEQVGSFAQALRRAGEHLDVEGNTQGAKAAHTAARQVDRVAGYLSDSDSNRILGDVEQATRRRPWVTGGVAAALGFAASRFLKASSEGRYEASRHPAPWPGGHVDTDLPLSRELPAAPADLPVSPTPPLYSDGPDTRFS